MPRFSSRCKIAVVFLLVMVLVAPWASASENRGRSEARGLQSWGLLERVWEVVSSLWAKAGASADPNGNPSFWTKNGASADPDGKPTSQPTTTTTATNSDNGASADPNG